VVGPVTEYYVAHSWTSTDPTSFGNEWAKHIRNGQFLQENGPLWFCLALLIFSAGYALFMSIWPTEAREDSKQQAPSTSAIIGFTLLMAASSFLVRSGHPPHYLNLPLGDFPQYILLFCAGIRSSQRGWLPKLSSENGIRWLLVVLPAGLIAWLALMIYVAREGCRSVRRLALAERRFLPLGVCYLRRRFIRADRDLPRKIQFTRTSGKVPVRKCI